MKRLLMIIAVIVMTIIHTKAVSSEELRFYKVKPISMTAEEQTVLAKNIYFEAGAEKYAGKIAVAQITYNRLKDGGWGKTIKKVVYAPFQFSWTLCDLKRNKKPSGPAWEASKKAARDFMNGLRISRLERVTHYHARHIRPDWAADGRKVAQIGGHIFYAM